MSRFANFQFPIHGMGGVREDVLAPMATAHVTGIHAGTPAGEAVLKEAESEISQRVAKYRQHYYTGVVPMVRVRVTRPTYTMDYLMYDGKETIQIEPIPSAPAPPPRPSSPPDVLLIELVWPLDGGFEEVFFWAPFGTYTTYGDGSVDVDLAGGVWTPSFDPIEPAGGRTNLGIITTPRNLLARFALRTGPGRHQAVGVIEQPTPYGGWEKAALAPDDAVDEDDRRARARFRADEWGLFSDLARQTATRTDTGGWWTALLDTRWYGQAAPKVEIEVSGYWLNVFATPRTVSGMDPDAPEYEEFYRTFGHEPDFRKPMPTFSSGSFASIADFFAQPFFDQSGDPYDRAWMYDPVLPAPGPHPVTVIGTWVWFPREEYPVEAIVRRQYDDIKLQDKTHLSKILGTTTVSSVVVGQHRSNVASELPWGTPIGIVTADFSTLAISMRSVT